MKGLKRTRLTNSCAIPELYLKDRTEPNLCRFVTLAEGVLTWDEEKLTTAFSSEQRCDGLFLLGVFGGFIASADVLPLIWERGGQRSLERFREIVANDDAKGLLAGLSNEERTNLNVGVRDLYFASSRGLLSEEETTLLQSIVQLLEEEHPIMEYQGLQMSYYPTSSMKALRFLGAEAMPELNVEVRECVGRVAGHCLVFCDPSELHMRLFENILGLDKLIVKAGSLNFEIGDLKKCAGGAVTTGILSGSTDVLLELDTLPFYVEPLNKTQRGGKRFIFHSAKLADALLESLKTAQIEGVSADLVGVNPVFRMNSFAAGKSSFERHFDAPFYDPVLKHRSRHTMLIYLTGGSNSAEKNGVLEVDGHVLTELRAMQIVLFDQSLGHSGRAFEKGPKLFLRTDLIYECESNLRTEPRLGALFTRSVFLTKESIVSESEAFKQSLAPYEADHYDAVTQGHYFDKFQPSELKQPLSIWFHKQFDGQHYVTNGRDFFFRPDSGGVEKWTEKECAVVTVLDYFNASIDGESFAKLSKSQKLENNQVNDSLESISEFLLSKAKSKSGKMSHWTNEEKRNLVPHIELEQPDLKDEPVVCCPDHCESREAAEEMGLTAEDGPIWNMKRNRNVMSHYKACKSWVDRALSNAPICFIGQQIRFSREAIIVSGNSIQIGSPQVPQPVNFASCWNAIAPQAFVGVSEDNPAFNCLFPLLAPLMFKIYKNGLIRISLDFFDNSWMIRASSSSQVVPLPVLHDVAPDEYFDQGDSSNTWLHSAGASNEALGKHSLKKYASDDENAQSYVDLVLADVGNQLN